MSSHHIARTFIASCLVALVSSSATADILHKGVRQIFSGPSGFGSCATLADDAVTCWGNGTMTPSDPIHIGGQRVASVAVGNGYVCALVFDGTVWCWGDN